MELSDLRIFRAVAHTGGITRAAAQLHRVQSNVTTRIRQLEEQLGIALFLREGKRMQLSPAGKVLLDYTERLLALAQQAQDALHDSSPRGPLRLGTMESTAAARLPAPLSEFHRRHPRVALELRTGTTQHLIALVLNGELDAALVSEPVIDTRLEKTAAFTEELVLVTAAGHPPIKRPRDVSQRTLLTFADGCAYRKRLEDWFARHGSMLDRTVVLSSYHAILGCAVAGMGIAMLPRSVLDTFPERARLQVHTLPRNEHKSHTVLVWRRGTHSPKIDALATVLTGKRRQTRKRNTPPS